MGLLGMFLGQSGGYALVLAGGIGTLVGICLTSGAIRLACGQVGVPKIFRLD